MECFVPIFLFLVLKRLLSIYIIALSIVLVLLTLFSYLLSHRVAHFVLFFIFFFYSELPKNWNSSDDAIFSLSPFFSSWIFSSFPIIFPFLVCPLFFFVLTSWCRRGSTYHATLISMPSCCMLHRLWCTLQTQNWNRTKDHANPRIEDPLLVLIFLLQMQG